MTLSGLRLAPVMWVRVCRMARNGMRIAYTACLTSDPPGILTMSTSWSLHR